MNTVTVPLHHCCFYGYSILYKNLEDPGSEWTNRSVFRGNVDPIVEHVSGLIPYTNYSFRVFADSFQSVGLISEPFKVRTLQWGMYNLNHIETFTQALCIQDSHAVSFTNTTWIHFVTFLETNLKASFPGNPPPTPFVQRITKCEILTRSIKTPKHDEDKGRFPFNGKFQNLRKRVTWLTPFLGKLPENPKTVKFPKYEPFNRKFLNF